MGEGLEDAGKFQAAAGTVGPMVAPSNPLPEAKVGGGGGEVDVDHFEFAAVGEEDGGLLIAAAGSGGVAVDVPAGDDAVGVVAAEFAMAGEERVREAADLIGEGFLNENDVRLPGGEVGGRIAIVE